MTTTVNHVEPLAVTAALLMSRLSGRTDVYLIQKDGYIQTVRAPVTDELVVAHLRGECRLGCFPITNGMTRWLCWDIDRDDLTIIRALQARCIRWGLPVLIERSKSKGYHLWVFFSEPVSAGIARKVGQHLMSDVGIECEVFPKQDGLKENGIGNGVFLPWHGKSIKEDRTVFIHPETLVPYPDQLDCLRFQERLPSEWIECVWEMSRKPPASPPSSHLVTSVQEAIKKATYGTRHDIGFDLACRLRDEHLAQAEAEPLMLEYARAVKNLGEPEYSQNEALKTLSSAYSQTPRDKKEPAGKKLVALANSHAQFVHTADNSAYALINGDHSEVVRLNSKRFKQWLARKYFEEERKVTSGQAISNAILVLEGQALCGQEVSLYLRIAQWGGNLIIDLCNAARESVEVNATGWRILQEAPVHFRQPRGMLALTRPVVGGSLEELRKFINVSCDHEWYLLVVWLLYVLKGHGPFLILVIQGEQGAGKTTIVRFLRAIIDPNVSLVRSEPKEVRDLLISAVNAYVLAFDNLSFIPPWLSDALCRLSTGGGFATRQLYADDEEVVLDAVRPVILNGIEALPTRSDLLDRTLFMTVPTINEGTRRSEGELQEAFEQVRGRIFGALLTALSKTLAELPTVKLERMPRMADFGIFGVAVERALGWPSGSFLCAYDENRMEAHYVALEGSAIAGPLEELMNSRGQWEGTASELLNTLNGMAPYEITTKRGWPSTPRQLANQLTRMAPNLRSVGITVQKDRKGHAGTRVIYLQQENKSGENDLKDSTKQEQKTNSTIHPHLAALSKSWKPINHNKERR